MHTRKAYTTQFASTLQRDSFIDRYFPTRKCGTAPGTYKVPGGWITVYSNQVTISWGAARKAPEEMLLENEFRRD